MSVQIESRPGAIAPSAAAGVQFAVGGIGPRAVSDLRQKILQCGERRR